MSEQGQENAHKPAAARAGAGGDWKATWWQKSNEPGVATDRAHFFAVAAQAMRRVLVDHARGKHRQKRGGGQRPMLLSDVCCTVLPRDIELLALDEALEALAAEDPTDARIVEMRFFAGVKVREIAAVLEVNEKTVQRRWNYAKARLQQLIGFEAGTAAPKKPPSGAPWSGRSSSPGPRRIDARAPNFVRRHCNSAWRRENLRVSPGGFPCSWAFA